MKANLYRYKILTLAVFIITLFLVIPSAAKAGNVSATDRYAWTENSGWLDFGDDANGDIIVGDDELTGYAYGENIGWLSLNCSNTSSCGTVDYKVENDGDGNLSGYAWGENIGWVDFDPTNGGVTIDTSTGDFSGYAYGENVGWIVFNCATTSSCGTVNYKVNTTWRPPVVAPPPPSSSSGGGSAPWRRRQNQSNTQPVIPNLIEIIPNILNPFSSPEPEPKPSTLPIEPTPEVAQAAFASGWNLISMSDVGNFVLAPLPSEITDLALKFPELQDALVAHNITRVRDLGRLKEANLVLPGITKEAGIQEGVSIPIDSLTENQKAQIPTDVVFAKAGDSIDYGVAFAVTESGLPRQELTTVAGKPIDLAIKVDKPVEGVRGYVAVKNIEREMASRSIPATSLMAAPLAASLAVVHPEGEQILSEDVLVVGEFEYTDDNHDGIYVASAPPPKVHGEYEIISVLDYQDEKLGQKELRITLLIDPEGYIYEKSGDNETRIPNAKVTLEQKNPQTGIFETWPAPKFGQVNPQKTDKTGNYSFLVPSGTYKLVVETDKYYLYESSEFAVAEGRGVHMNIELKKKSWLRNLFQIFN